MSNIIEKHDKTVWDRYSNRVKRELEFLHLWDGRRMDIKVHTEPLGLYKKT